MNEIVLITIMSAVAFRPTQFLSDNFRPIAFSVSVFIHFKDCAGTEVI